MSNYSHTLSERLSAATSVRATAVGEFDPRRRAESRDQFRVTDAEDLRALVATLRIQDDSLIEEIAFTTTGDLQLNFLLGHELVESVALLIPGYIRSRSLPFDARLVDSVAVQLWLSTHGWTAPSGGSAAPMVATSTARLRFRIEACLKQRPAIVFARRLTPGDFTLRDGSTLGGVPLRPILSMPPRMLKPDGTPAFDVFTFTLASRRDLERLPVGSEVDLIP